MTPYSAIGGPTARRGTQTVTSELVERAQRGDHEAFDALAAAAVHRLYAVARRILRDPYAAEDAVQDTLVRAWRDLPALRERDRFEAWLHRLLVHACADQVRRARRRPIEVSDVSLHAPSPSDDIANFVERDEIEHAFLQLDVEHRAALVLVHYAGIPASEVARILDVPTGTVYSRLHYGARRMREVLRPPTQAVVPEQGQ
jgi:RNA polymerase sigma-70 factor, ECF subfamily